MGEAAALPPSLPSTCCPSSSSSMRRLSFGVNQQLALSMVGASAQGVRGGLLPSTCEAAAAAGGAAEFLPLL